jgi:hypothetical protein
MLSAANDTTQDQTGNWMIQEPSNWHFTLEDWPA